MPCYHFSRLPSFQRDPWEGVPECPDLPDQHPEVSTCLVENTLTWYNISHFQSFSSWGESQAWYLKKKQMRLTVQGQWEVLIKCELPNVAFRWIIYGAIYSSSGHEKNYFLVHMDIGIVIEVVLLFNFFAFWILECSVRCFNCKHSFGRSC